MNYKFTPLLHHLLDNISLEDKVNADLEGVTVKQYKFNCWMKDLKDHGEPEYFNFLRHPVKLARWKYWLWSILPDWILGVDNCVKFRGWKIGHCLNCDADPYDGKILSWSYYGNIYRGALIQCNKCGQLRWQIGDNGYDY